MKNNPKLTVGNFLEISRNKWTEIPAGDVERCNSLELMKLDEDALLSKWCEAHHKATTAEYFNVRGWYQALYKDVLRGKRVLDVGCGFGIDGIYFAQNGAEMTFLDIAKSNLNIVSRICSYLNLQNTNFVHLDTLSKMKTLRKISNSFDFIWCQGSLINAPSDVVKYERALLLELLPPGGRWIELAYPKSRWDREGRMPFNQWGEKTDGGAPWIEWYDLEKLKFFLSPAKFNVILQHEFFDNNFIWFDLLRLA